MPDHASCHVLLDEEQDKESVGSSSSQRTESIAQNYGSVGRQQPELQDPPMGSLHLAGSLNNTFPYNAPKIIHPNASEWAW